MGILSTENKKKIKNGEKVVLSVDVGTNQYMNVRIKEEGEGYTIKARLHSKNPELKLGKQIQKKVRDLSVVENQIRTLGCELAEKINGGTTRKVTKRKISKDEIATIVESVPGIYEPYEWGVRKNGRYLNPNTIKDQVRNTITTYQRIFERFNTIDPTPEDLITFRTEEIERIYCENKRNNKNPVTKESVKGHLYDKWKYINEAIKICKRLLPDENWPVNSLPVGISVRLMTPDLLKVVSFERYIKISTVIIRLCKLEVQEAFAASPEVFCGARVGESAAFQMGRYDISGELGRYYINQQVDRNGNITGLLKNEYSYRYVFLNGIMLDLYEIKQTQLRNRGIDEKTIADSFLGSSYDDVLKPLRKEKVSAFLRKLLLLVGVSKNEVAILQEEANGELGDDADNDLCAHLFRRVFATYTSNGGIDTNVVDAILGHENRLNAKSDYAGWDFVPIITGMLNRCYCFGSLTGKQGNPKYKPETVSRTDLVELEGNIGYRLTASESGIMRLTIESVESEEEIKVKISGLKDEPSVDSKAVYDTEKQRKQRIIYSHLPELEEIERWISEAMALDIDCFLERTKKDE